MAAKTIEKQVHELASSLFELLGINATFELTTASDDTGDIVTIEITADTEAGLLIGNHGSTLHAIESFLSLALRQQTGEWVRIVADIGQWRQKHEEYLTGLAEQAAHRAKETGEPQHLYNLTPAQRRVIHTALSALDGISTESLGEGDDRYLVIKPV